MSEIYSLIESEFPKIYDYYLDFKEIQTLKNMNQIDYFLNKNSETSAGDIWPEGVNNIKSELKKLNFNTNLENIKLFLMVNYCAFNIVDRIDEDIFLNLEEEVEEEKYNIQSAPENEDELAIFHLIGIRNSFQNLLSSLDKEGIEDVDWGIFKVKRHFVNALSNEDSIQSLIISKGKNFKTHMLKHTVIDLWSLMNTYYKKATGEEHPKKFDGYTKI